MERKMAMRCFHLNKFKAEKLRIDVFRTVYALNLNTLELKVVHYKNFQFYSFSEKRKLCYMQVS